MKKEEVTKQKNKIQLKRVNMNLPENLVNRVVEYGESLGLNTTSAYIVLLNQALNQQKTMDNLPALLQAASTLQSLTQEMDDDSECDDIS